MNTTKRKSLFFIMMLALTLSFVISPQIAHARSVALVEFADAKELTSNVSTSGTVEAGSEVHYKLTLPSSGKVEFLVKNESAKSSGIEMLRFLLYDSNGELILSRSLDENKKVAPVYYFRAGTYYVSIVVPEYCKAQKYSLLYALTSANESFGESATTNDDIASTANAITFDIKYRGQYGYNDSFDYYVFTVPMNGEITINYHSDKAYAAFRLLDKNNNKILSGFIDRGSTSLSKKIQLKAGTYYLVGDYGTLTGENTDNDDWGFYDFSLTYKTTDTVVISKAKRSGSKLNLAWKKIEGAQGYEVAYSTSKSFKKSNTKIVKVSGLKKKIKIVKKKKYYVRVRAYAKVGNKTYYTKYSKTKKIK